LLRRDVQASCRGKIKPEREKTPPRYVKRPVGKGNNDSLSKGGLKRNAIKEKKEILRKKKPNYYKRGGERKGGFLRFIGWDHRKVGGKKENIWGGGGGARHYQ